MLLKFFLILIDYVFICDSARILAVFPAPFPSHQAVFRPFVLELANRGHEVVVITTNPKNKDLPKNYTEIDVQDVSYKFRNRKLLKTTGHSDDIYEQVEQFFDDFAQILEIQMESKELKKLVNDRTQHFDLLITEACVRSALVFSHLYKAPVIMISSLGSLNLYTEYLGVPQHPILYPGCGQQSPNNPTLWDKAKEICKYYYLDSIFKSQEINEDKMLKRVFGEDVPPLKELKKNVAMLMINVHHIWEGNRPVPANVLYLGGLHLASKDIHKMTPELKEYLDSSQQGVIYMSLGSVVVPSILENIKIVIQALSKLPYNILLKWDTDHLPNCPPNFKVMKWTPQRDLLYHPNIKLFITQGGLQSTDEAIVAGVPLLGIPILGDQWYNVEKYVQFKIGLGIELHSVTEEKVIDAVNAIVSNESFKRNIQDLNWKLFDQPQNALDRAVWWTEYILRHRNNGIYHPQNLASPAAHLSGWEYYEMDFILAIVVILCLFFLLVGSVGYLVVIVNRNYGKELKVKQS